LADQVHAGGGNLIATRTECPLGNTRAGAGGLFIARSV